MANGLRPFALPRPDALSPPRSRSLRRHIIPDDMGIPFPEHLALSGWGDADFHAGVNFAFWAFSEVRGSQASMALCSSEESVDPTSKRDPRKEAPNAHHHRPVDSRCSNASCGRWAGVGAAPILNRPAQATQRRGRLHLRRLGKMERGRGPYY